MEHIIVQYEVKPEHADNNEALVRAVYAELQDMQPDHFHYATFVAEDGVSFTHVASRDDGSPNPLAECSAFAEFQRDIASRCASPPSARTMREVGSYAWQAVAAS